MRRAASLGAGTSPSAPVFVMLSGFFAYFEHRRRAPNLAAAAAVRPPLPLFFGHRRRYLVAAAAARPPPSSSSSTSSSPASPSSTPTASSTPTTAGDIGPAPIGAATVVESFSAGLSDFSDMVYSSCRSLVYACPVLATPPCAFVHDVSPGLASLARRFVNFVFVCRRMPGAGNTGACLRP